MIATRNLPALVALSGGMTGSKLRRLKARRWKYPLGLERQYTAAISKFLTKVWKDYAVVAVGTMLPRADAVDLNPDGTGPALAAIVSVAKNMADFNKKELGAFQSIAIGTAFTEDETWLPATLDRWAREQVSLITKASQDMRDAVARRVREGIKNGELGRDITRKIAMDLPRISYNRAKIIARDQTAKLNGDLTQGRMADAGLETYIWDTAQDERVRGNPGGKYADAVPSHWVMQGLVCRWDNPAVCRNEQGEWVSRPPEAPTTHPGMAIMCRCVARPNWEELENVGPLDVPVAAGVTASSIPEPEPVPPVPEVDPGILGKTSDQFIDNVKRRFDTAEDMDEFFLRNAWARLQNLPQPIRAAMGTRLDNLYQLTTSKSEAYYQPAYNRVCVRASKKGAGAVRGSDLVHEVGHALDNALGKASGTGYKYASAIPLAEFGDRNLAQIIRDELVDPMLAAAKKDRPNVVRRMVYEAREALRATEKKLGDDFYDLPSIMRLYNAKQYSLADLLRQLKAGPDIFAALEDGETDRVVSYITGRLELKTYSKAAVIVDKRSVYVTSVLDDLKAAGDETSILDSFSDMVEAATGNTGYFGYAGHGAKYWRNDPKYSPSTEAFAEILEMMGSTSTGASRILNKYLPTARDFVVKAIEGGNL